MCSHDPRRNAVTERDRFRGCLLGLAAGDAVGTTVEFQPRGSFAPVIDMVGGGPFHLQPGQWTDDTSMALCLATSLVETGGFDARDQIERYVRWATQGYLSSTGTCFDIGTTVASSLARYRRTNDPNSGLVDPRSAGNGSIMRLAPVPMFFHPDFDAAIRHSEASSRTTHGCRECLDACRLFGAILFHALAGDTKEEILIAAARMRDFSPRIDEIAKGDYRSKGEGEIRGSGYVVESLEAALCCFWRSRSFEEAILRAANLGDDADTTAAVCGQVAGAFYGETGIPAAWREKVTLGREIGELADRLHEAEPPPARPGDAEPPPDPQDV